jgi:hypothetical protein
MNQAELDNFSAIILSFIIIIGIFGNLLNMFVFSRKSMRKNSTFRYLFYLSVIDLLVLLIGTSDALLTFGYFIMIRLYSDFLCKIHTYFTYFLTHMSSIVLMVVSIDRAMIVCDTKSWLAKYKDRMFIKSFFKSNYIEKIILSIVVILALFNIHYLMFIRLAESDLVFDSRLNGSSTASLRNERITYYQNMSILIKNDEILINHLKNDQTTKIALKSDQHTPRVSYVCFPSQNTPYNFFLLHIWIWIDMCVYSMIPFIIMLVCSIAILSVIKSKSRNFVIRNQTNESVLRITNKRNKQLLIMLIVTNSYFVLCTLPLGIEMINYKFKTNNYETHFLQTFFHTLAYTNNSFSFVFYITFSTKYRNVLKSVFVSSNVSNLN